MKKLLIFCLSLFIITAVSAQQIPNGSFENWTNPNTSLEPVDWLTVNFFTANYPTYGSLRSTDAYDGQFALELKSGIFDLTPGGFPIIDTSAIAILGTPSGPNSPPAGIPFTFRPQKLSFYYKYLPANNNQGAVDTARVYVRFTKLGNNIGEGIFNIYGNEVSSYTFHEIDINWYTNDMPDTMLMDLTSSIVGINYNSEPNTPNSLIGNTLLIDKLLFDYSVGIDDIAYSNKFTVYPNPANDIVTLNSKIVIGNETRMLNIYTMTGALVKSEKIQPNNRQISVADLSNGLYIVELSSQTGSAKQKLVIQR